MLVCDAGAQRCVCVTINALFSPRPATTAYKNHEV